MESELLSLGITYKHSRPYHPQTCGKVERFHQTMKKYLGAHKPARSIGALQALLDAFVAYYNTARPHRAIGRKTPEHAFGARKKARPSGNPLVVPPHCRVRQDKVNGGNVTLRYKSDLLHLGVGRRHNGSSVLLLVKKPQRANLDPRWGPHQGADNRPHPELPAPRVLKIVHDVSRQPSTMSRDCENTKHLIGPIG
jgi:Integrase core domain